MLLATAHEALAAGDWSAARSRFVAELAQEESAEALLGLGTAEWWLEERSASLRHRERAYADFRRRPDPLQAALVALGLVPHYGAALGNLAAAQGWTNRAARLVEQFDLAPLRGWVLLCLSLIHI